MGVLVEEGIGPVGKVADVAFAEVIRPLFGGGRERVVFYAVK